MTERPLLIVGAGGHGRVIAAAALAAGDRLLGFADSGRAGGSVMDLPVFAGEIGDIQRLCADHRARVAVAVGDNHARRRLHQQLANGGVTLATIVHPRALLLAGVRLGAGSAVLAGAILGVDAVVGEGAIINTAVTIDHDNQIGAFAHLSPGVHTGGEVTIGEGSHLGVGVSVRNRVRIGEWAQVGVGAAVVSDVPARVVAYGVPARVIRPLQDGPKS